MEDEYYTTEQVVWIIAIFFIVFGIGTILEPLIPIGNTSTPNILNFNMNNSCFFNVTL